MIHKSFLPNNTILPNTPRAHPTAPKIGGKFEFSIDFPTPYKLYPSIKKTELAVDRKLKKKCKTTAELHYL